MVYSASFFAFSSLWVLSLAASGANIFTQGDLVITLPVETLLMILVVILVVIGVEKGIHFFLHFSNQYFVRIVQLVLNEVSLFGILSLALLFFTTVFSNYPTVALLFDWAHVVLFIMAIAFIVSMSFFIWRVSRLWARWVRYERELVTMVSTAQQLQRNAPSGLSRVYFHKWQLLWAKRRLEREAGTRAALFLPEVPKDPLAFLLNAMPPHQRRAHAGAWAASDQLRDFLSHRDRRLFFFQFLRFRMDIRRLDPQFVGIPFCRYLKKCQRVAFTELFEIHFWSWVAVAMVSMVNSARATFFSAESADARSSGWVSRRELAMCLYVGIVGYLPLIPFILLRVWVNRSADAVASFRLSDDNPATLMRDLVSSTGLAAEVEAFELLLDVMPARRKRGIGLELAHSMDGRETLILGSHTITLRLLQVFLLMSLYYLGIFLVAIVYELSAFKWFFNIIVGPLAMLPPLIFLLLVPSITQQLTVLSSTGHAIIAPSRLRILASIAAKNRKKNAGEENVDKDRVFPHERVLMPLGVCVEPESSKVKTRARSRSRSGSRRFVAPPPKPRGRLSQWGNSLAEWAIGREKDDPVGLSSIVHLPSWDARRDASFRAERVAQVEAATRNMAAETAREPLVRAASDLPPPRKGLRTGGGAGGAAAIRSPAGGDDDEGLWARHGRPPPEYAGMDALAATTIVMPRRAPQVVETIVSRNGPPDSAAAAARLPAGWSNNYSTPSPLSKQVFGAGGSETQGKGGVLLSPALKALPEHVVAAMPSAPPAKMAPHARNGRAAVPLGRLGGGAVDSEDEGVYDVVPPARPSALPPGSPLLTGDALPSPRTTVKVVPPAVRRGGGDGDASPRPGGDDGPPPAHPGRFGAALRRELAAVDADDSSDSWDEAPSPPRTRPAPAGGRKANYDDDDGLW